MPKLKEIRTPIAEHIDLFEKKFRHSMKSKVPLLDTITRYIYKRKGKQMRPMFVFFQQEFVVRSTNRVIGQLHLSNCSTLPPWYTMMLWTTRMYEGAILDQCFVEK